MRIRCIIGTYGVCSLQKAQNTLSLSANSFKRDVWIDSHDTSASFAQPTMTAACNPFNGTNFTVDQLRLSHLCMFTRHFPALTINEPCKPKTSTRYACVQGRRTQIGTLVAGGTEAIPGDRACQQEYFS